MDSELCRNRLGQWGEHRHHAGGLVGEGGGGERGPGHGDGEPVLRHVEGEVLPHHREAVQSDVAGHWSESGESVGGGGGMEGDDQRIN